MSDNIIDFTQRLQARRTAGERPVILTQYDLGTSSLIMGPELQLDLIIDHAILLYEQGDLNHRYIHKLSSMLKYIYEGLFPPFDFKVTIAPREYPHLEGLDRWSVYSWGMDMERMVDRTNESEIAPAIGRTPSFQMSLEFVKFDDGDVIDRGTIYPEDWMVFDIAADDTMTQRMPRHLIRKMNNLVKINGGLGMIVEEGGYMVVLPYGNNWGVVISLVLENSITLLPEEERKR